ncbi:MAG TPA: aspartate aminotransferase family protein [Acidiphilium sp.]|nr:aspartate aminotransferase family protein [Acidiphilium sp.]HQU22711.1 aspartate aminotransferase family protein [Acidiphilium sp.]
MIPALMPNYNRMDIAFDHGEGAWLFTRDGRRFLDFGAGIATSSLGHGHPGLTRAIAEQAARVMHVSNLYRVPQAEQLAERLTATSFADSVFFCNSGAEANEALVKAFRKTMADEGKPERYRIICAEGAFHGRTLAMISATGNAKYLAGFGPAVDGFDHVPFNNLNALRDAITPETAGILVEPIQGEGGIRPAQPDYLRGLRAAADEFSLLLGFDEVQCGMGRTGKLFAHEWAGITPDAVSTAKGIGGGFPLGALLANERVAQHLIPGTHGTTYGGNPLACAAGNAVLDVVLAPGFLDQLCATGARLHDQLERLVAAEPTVFSAVRGHGLMLGLVCAVPNTDMQSACLAEGLLVVAAGENVIRLVPPLIIGDAECDEAIGRLRSAAKRCRPMPTHLAAQVAAQVTAKVAAK